VSGTLTRVVCWVGGGVSSIRVRLNSWYLVHNAYVYILRKHSCSSVRRLRGW
jgi:hypothetical protein